jgi:hypothetical protein
MLPTRRACLAAAVAGPALGPPRLPLHTTVVVGAGSDGADLAREAAAGRPRLRLLTVGVRWYGEPAPMVEFDPGNAADEHDLRGQCWLRSPEIAAALEGAGQVVVVARLGAYEECGIAPAVADLAWHAGLGVRAAVSMPRHVEGVAAMARADAALGYLAAHCERLAVLGGGRCRPGDPTRQRVFQLAADLLDDYAQLGRALAAMFE